MKTKFVGSPYTKDPTTIQFDPLYVEKNNQHTEAQYESTKLLIKEQGQTKPIYLLDGRCVDGRHRTKIAIELGREVMCQNLNPELTNEEITILCNEDVLSGRDYNISQRAIWALRELVLGLGISMTKAASMSKVDRRMVSYASTLRGLGREDILDILMKGERVQLDNMARPSSSLEVICKNAKAEAEEDKVISDNSERVHFDPEAIIKTEKGKAWFYETIQQRGISSDKYDVMLDYMELANFKYRKRGNDE